MNKNIWFFTNHNNTIYLHVFQMMDDFYKYYFPIIEKIIESTEFIEYTNSSYATYEDTQFGIKFKYPPYKLQDSDFKYTRYGWIELFDAFQDNTSNDFTVLAKNKPISDDFNLKDFKREMIHYHSSSSYDNIINDSSDFKEYELNSLENKNYIIYKNEDHDSNISENIISTYIKKGDQVYSFVYNVNNRSLLNLPMYNQIIESTEFIEYTNSSYATYEDTQFGIKFNYPYNWNERYTYFEYNLSEILPIEYINGTLLEQSSVRPIAEFNSNFLVDIEKELSDMFLYYFMAIDILSVFDNGVDYAIQIQWNNTSYNWDRIFAESSATGGSRIIDIEYGVSDFYDTSKQDVALSNFITFSLELEKINNPSIYNILFGAGAGFFNELGEWCKIDDLSQMLPIPPPTYGIIPTNNNPLTLYPNDEKTIDISISSESSVSSTVFLDSNKNNSISVEFVPDVIFLNPNEQSISKMKIITNNTSIETHSIPINANITFSSETRFNLLGESRNHYNPVMTNIELESNLTIIVEEVPPIYQPVVDFSKNVIEPSAGFITATIIPIITAITGLIVYLKRKSQS